MMTQQSDGLRLTAQQAALISDDTVDRHRALRARFPLAAPGRPANWPNHPRLHPYQAGRCVIRTAAADADYRLPIPLRSSLPNLSLPTYIASLLPLSLWHR